MVGGLLRRPCRWSASDLVLVDARASRRARGCLRPCAFISRSMRRTSACSMIGTRGAVASFQCVMLAPCLRSFAYSSAFRYALEATATPWTPTEMRAPFISLNICGMP